MRCRLLLPLLDAATWVVARLPQPLLLAMGRALAWLGWPLLAARRRVARRNIDLCFPDLDAAARRQLADASVVNAVIGALEMVRGLRAPAATVRALTRIEGLELLRAALQRGGVLLLMGHATPIELAVRMTGEALGRRPREIARAHGDACLERWIDGARSQVYAPTIDKKDTRTLLRALRGGELVAMAADQDFRYQHVFVPFFGVPAATLAVLPDIVRRGEATLLPLRYRRDDDGRYTLRIGPAWDDWPSGDVQRDAGRYMAELEDAVREAPEQYLWVHRRFKTRPPGSPPVYDAVR